jgi:hypothetical protein
MIKNAKGKKEQPVAFWTLHLTIPNSPITYNLSNFITGCRSLGDKIIEVLLYKDFWKIIFWLCVETWDQL